MKLPPVAVVEMLGRIHRGGLSPENCMHDAKDRNNRFRLFGLGHRIYRNDDPTTKTLRPRQIYTGPNETDHVPIEKR